MGPNKKEGYINNNHPTDKPDNKQFYACHDYTQKDNLGNNFLYIRKMRDE